MPCCAVPCYATLYCNIICYAISLTSFQSPENLIIDRCTTQLFCIMFSLPLTNNILPSVLTIPLYFCISFLFIAFSQSRTPDLVNRRGSSVWESWVIQSSYLICKINVLFHSALPLIYCFFP